MVMATIGSWSFSQSWVISSLVLYVIELANARLVLIPTSAKMIEMMRAGPPEAVKMEAAGKRLAVAGTLSHLLFTAIVIVMIWKPGL